MPHLRLLLTPLALATIAVPAAASEPANPQIDYDDFARLTADLAGTRQAHLLPWEEFSRQMSKDGALLLDARSAEAFAGGHIEGAVNLPLPDFTDEALRDAIGPDRNRPIYIYCNNNFTDNRTPVPTKRAPMALNIATFINLHGYGYTNVWELGGLLETADVPWVTAPGLASN
ncbi:MAG TPA: rhodanese-like domain-containing protein [Sphingomonadaceae bacterium]|nr:rhodanese-like domain-containing protein [Sphingomonadaceae bacterium]